MSAYYKDSVPYSPITSSAEQKIREGQSYVISHWLGSLVNGTQANLYIKSSSISSHLRSLRFASEAGQANVNIYEDAVASANGSQISATNLNRRSNNQSGLTIFSNPTIASSGNLIFSMTKFSATGSGPGQGISAGGGYLDAEGEELILKYNANYFVNIAYAGATGNVRIGLGWHEGV